VSSYAILQHFGIDKDIWEQDVQNRVFATIGQPNWLAAWIVSIIPITWGLILAKNKGEGSKFLFYGAYLLSFTLFLTLLYTKSRSGILGFGLSLVIFIGTTLFLTLKKKSPLNKKVLLKSSLLISGVYLFIAILIGTPWSPSVNKLLSNSNNDVPKEVTVVGPALETGGTDSGEIRKIVWKGAYDVWKDNPIFGTGVETFAFSYYKFRPIEHNLVSEWDFLYNKAHNEYLNYLATIGIVGLSTYILLVLSVFVLFIRNIKNSLSKESSIQLLLPISFMAGFAGVLITNIFGFSVVLISLNMFLLPAFAVSLVQKRVDYSENHTSNLFQKVSLFVLIFIFVFLTSKVFFYWYSDVLYTKAKNENRINDYSSSILHINEAVDYQPYQAVYYDELADTEMSIALLMFTNNELEDFDKYKDKALISSEKAIELSPYNMNLRRNNASIYLKLSTIDEEYLPKAAEVINEAIVLAPTDAKLYYNLGVVIAKMGLIEEAVEIFTKTIDMKTNYRDARFALGILYSQEGEIELAKEQFQYILDNIAPNDKKTQEELDKI
jgi:O-antigen ligase